MNLYTVLGVDRTATPAQIKTAYRKLAKTAHPDGDGEREAWDKIQHAYEVLSNQLRRDKYDATGDDTQIPDPEAQERAQVASIVRQIISGVLQSSRDDPGRTNFRSRILIDLEDTQFQMKQDQSQLKLKIARVERFIGRFVKDDGSDDIVGDVIKQGVRDLEAQIDQVDGALKLHEKVTAVFLQYRYELDPSDSEGQNLSDGSSHQRGYLLGGSRSR